MKAHRPAIVGPVRRAVRTILAAAAHALVAAAASDLDLHSQKPSLHSLTFSEKEMKEKGLLESSSSRHRRAVVVSCAFHALVEV